jgi:hypothetical protein
MCRRIVRRRPSVRARGRVAHRRRPQEEPEMFSAWRGTRRIPACIDYPLNAIFARHCTRVPTCFDARLRNSRTRRRFGHAGQRGSAMYSDHDNQCAGPSNGMHASVLSNALVQLQARYNHCGEAASEKCLSAATFVRRFGAEAAFL